MYCAPSLGGESFGVVLLEAMAAGVAVVASDIDGYRNVATESDHALLVPPNDPAALAEALTRVLGDQSHPAVEFDDAPGVVALWAAHHGHQVTTLGNRIELIGDG